MNMEEIIQKKLRLVFNDESIIYDKSRFAGGLTNYNYIMNIQGLEYVIRQPGGMTDQIIDRKVEHLNNTITSKLGINSECVYFDEVSGIKISTFIKNAKNIALSDPCSPANLRAVSTLMKKVHSGPIHFPNTFDWQSELNKYEQIVKELTGDFFFDYDTLKIKLVDFVNENITTSVTRPCHNDTVPENFIINDLGRAYLIDWEYSGMNDPCWDVAAYILESKLNEEAIDLLLVYYFGQLPTIEEVVKIKCYMLVQDLLWTVWALIRHYNGEDFLDYCHFRYERFRKNIKSLPALTDCTIAEMVKI
ncbi:phosphotransferase [Neobacillus sp. FSL H8-0543]|uniref:choline kinase family protein n=1 Tax=Neobacillus sp. FSL H8-0543 TaxID=2954672 RepID=UPI003158F8F6